jgi:hypothetical protein
MFDQLTARQKQMIAAFALGVLTVVIVLLLRR